MNTNPRLGDYMSNSCPRCRKLVRSRVELRSVGLARTRLVVPDVPVDICPNCGHMISVVPDGIAQLREAGCPK